MKVYMTVTDALCRKARGKYPHNSLVMELCLALEQATERGVRVEAALHDALKALERAGTREPEEEPTTTVPQGRGEPEWPPVPLGTYGPRHPRPA